MAWLELLDFRSVYTVPVDMYATLNTKIYKAIGNYFEIKVHTNAIRSYAWKSETFGSKMGTLLSINVFTKDLRKPNLQRSDLPWHV